MANDVAMEQRELAEMQPENVEEVETESVPESDIKNATNASEVVDNQSVTTSNFGETMNVLQQVFDKNCTKKTFTRENQCRCFNHCRGNHLANSKHLG